jgi:hypothetical protein
MLARPLTVTTWALMSMFIAMQSPSRAEEQAGQGRANAAPGREELFRKFEREMSGVKLVGQFTIQGRDQDELPKEEYEIRSVKKMPAGDVWLFTARIKYGSHDLTLPLPLDVKWAGNTPVITLDNVTIPVLGTFSCRVVLDGDKYAGTWTHGDVGGHMFGLIEKLDRPAREQESP